MHGPSFGHKKPVPGVDRIVAIASGKGGVGKSSVTMNLAVTMARKGLRVGILDADIYGPSLPTMMGFQNNQMNGGEPPKPDIDHEKRMIPLRAHDVACMSIGFLAPKDSATIWRGPMAQSAVLQLLYQVAWGELDYLLMDLPPGTGDIHLTLAQQVCLTGILIVSTPQDIALIDAHKALAMARRMGIPCLGVIENMSGFTCPHCHTCTPIFHEGGAQDSATQWGVPFLGTIPLSLSVREGGDMGKPAVLWDSAIANAYDEIVTRYFI